MEEYSNSLKNDMYACQLFGFTSKAFMDFFHRSISREIAEALDEIHAYMKREMLPCTDTSEENLIQGAEQLKGFYDNYLAKNIDRLEVYLENNILRIPSNVVLPEDKVQEQNHDLQENAENLESDIIKIRRKIKASYYSRLAMHTKINHLNKMQENANHLLDKINGYIVGKSFLDGESYKQLLGDAKASIDVFSEMSASQPRDEGNNDLRKPSYPLAKKQRTL